MDVEIRKDLCQTLESLTHSGNPSLDQALMKKVKQICKSSELYINCAYEALMRDLAKDHSEVRLSTFQVMDQLFQRSHSFRRLISIDFQKVLSLVSGVSPLPEPKAAADKLKQFGLLTIRQWVERFGEGYPKLKLGYNYLKHNKKVDFEQLIAATEGEHRQREIREARQRAFMEQRLEKIKLEMREQSQNIHSCFKEMESCFQIIMPDLFESDGMGLRIEAGGMSLEETENTCNDNGSDDSDVEWEEIATTEGEDPLAVNGLVRRSLNVVTVTIPDKVKIKQEENESLIETLKEHYKLLTKTYLPRINKWIEWFTKGGDEASLKEAIDYKAEAITLKDKYRELQIVNIEGEEEIESDESPDIDDILSFDTTSSSIVKGSVPWSTIHYRRHPSLSAAAIEEELALDPTTPQAQIKAKGLLNKVTIPLSSTSTCSSSSAPSVPYDVDLISWGKSSIPDLTPTAMDSLHRYWCEDKDITISQDMQSLSKCRTITFAGQFKPIKWACRAPLSNGKLCPRKDKYKCPLHGPIVARDEQGQPVADTESSSSASTQLPSNKPNKVRKARQKKHPGLTDIKESKKTAKGRVEAKILNKRTLSKVGKCLDSLSQKKAKAKFVDYFNYSLKS